MRTTLTLDDDVQAKLDQEARRSGKFFKEVVNYYLRLGIHARHSANPPRKFVVRARPMGLREELPSESIASLLEQLEGPLHR